MVSVAAEQVGGYAAGVLLGTLSAAVAGESKRTAELARTLASLPATRDALANGDISVDQAAQIGRAADRGILGEAPRTGSATAPGPRTRSRKSCW